MFNMSVSSSDGWFLDTFDRTMEMVHCRQDLTGYQVGSEAATHWFSLEIVTPIQYQHLTQQKLWK